MKIDVNESRWNEKSTYVNMGTVQEIKPLIAAAFFFIGIFVLSQYTVVPLVEKTKEKTSSRELILNSSCLKPQEFVLNLVSDTQLNESLQEIPELRDSYKKLTNAFSFGVGVQCPPSSPIVLRVKIPRFQAPTLTQSRLYLTTIKKIFSEEGLQKPSYEFPLYLAKKVEEKKDYFVCEFEIQNTEAKNPYFVVLANSQ